MNLTILGELSPRIDSQGGACALIAIKERVRCKTRLTGSLTPFARIQLARSMLSTVLSAAVHAQTIRQIIVMSPERDFVPSEIPVLVDTGKCLNSALIQAHRVLREVGCREVVILPADLPTVTAAEIDTLVLAGRRGGCAIAPDTAGSGTNALCLASSCSYRFQFGRDSQRLHRREAERNGLTPQLVRLPGLEFDVDSSADLYRLAERQWGT
jgi:2-phospho-L-lactate guanylyltransferase